MSRANDSCSLCRSSRVAGVREGAQLLDDRSVEDALGRLRRDRRRCAAQRVRQLVERKGLCEVVVHAGLEAALPVGVGGQADDRDMCLGRLATADCGGRLVAVHDRHVAVHEDRRVAARRGSGHRRCAVGDDIDAEAEALEHERLDLPVDGVILGQQYVGPRRLGVSGDALCTSKHVTHATCTRDVLAGGILGSEYANAPKARIAMPGEEPMQLV